MAEIEKPIPRANDLTRPFWEAAARGELVMQRCNGCGAFVWCPRASCGECGGDHLDWQTVSGRGTVFSFTVVREALGRRARSFEKDIPYVVAWIELEEGPRLCSNVVGCEIDKVAIGMPVEVVFEEAGRDIYLPKFKPRSG